MIKSLKFWYQQKNRCFTVWLFIHRFSKIKKIYRICLQKNFIFEKGPENITLKLLKYNCNWISFTLTNILHSQNKIWYLHRCFYYKIYIQHNMSFHMLLRKSEDFLKNYLFVTQFNYFYSQYEGIHTKYFSGKRKF